MNKLLRVRYAIIVQSEDQWKIWVQSVSAECDQAKTKAILRFVTAVAAHLYLLIKKCIEFMTLWNNFAILSIH